MNHTHENNDNDRTVLNTLRALVPNRQVTFTEALRIAEQQAHRLLWQLPSGSTSVSLDLLLQLPRITVEQVSNLPTSGFSFWDTASKTWIIQTNADEPLTRQRLSSYHEYKHIVDHSRTAQLYGTGLNAAKHAEQAADFFAGCVLMPRSLVKRAWGEGMQTPDQLAAWFDVSPQAARVRIAQIGLAEDSPRDWQRPQLEPRAYRRRHGYFRAQHPAFQGASV